MSTDLLLCTFGMIGWFGALASLGVDRRAGSGPKHRNPGLPRMRRSGTKPRRRADFTQAA